MQNDYPKPTRERKPRKYFGVNLKGEPVLPAATERQLALCSNPDDHTDRFVPLFDGHGRQAKVQCGSDCECNQDDDVADTGMTVCSTRDYTEFLVEDDGGEANKGVRTPDVLDEMIEMQGGPTDEDLWYDEMYKKIIAAMSLRAGENLQHAH